ncbi:MAG: CYTH and CHAD domain-containing protein [Mycobacterium sp.]|nr:CYTH and CHAD domain-containing protein [Mycobacterium sp.]
MTQQARAAAWAVSRHKEVERKFDVGESVTTPSFDSLDVVARVERLPPQVLDAVYFDTPGGDLAAHQVTLRRRTGGNDSGWHLKLPAGPDTRTETRMPLSAGENNVPEGLRDIVLAIVRDRPLAPVARISTNRTIDMLYGVDGSALAELADDHVTASAAGDETTQHWREWELELSESAIANGRADDQTLRRLSKRLRDAGALPASHPSKLARVLGTSSGRPKPVVVNGNSVHSAVGAQLEELLTWDRAVRADVVDSVHQMRVTIRTIRSLLQASPAAFGLTEDARMLEELRELAAVLGTARDAEVLADRYQQALDELPDKLVRGPIRARLIDGALHRYRTGLQASVAAMRSEHYFRLLDAVEALVVTESLGRVRRAKQLAEATVADGHQRIRKRVKDAAAADAEHHDVALHRIRKSAKRLRYTAAAEGVTKVADAAKVIQTVLGDHQDSVVSRAHLVEQADAAHTAGEDTFTYGLLYHHEVDVAQECEQELHAALQALDKAVRRAR